MRAVVVRLVITARQKRYLNQTYIPVNNTDVWGVAVGGTNTSAILTDGYVYTWGASDLGQIGNGTAGQSSDTETNELVPAKTGEDYISLDEYFATLHEGETSVINPVYNKFFNVIQNTDSCKTSAQVQ